jgi:hypothetical protein
MKSDGIHLLEVPLVTAGDGHVWIVALEDVHDAIAHFVVARMNVGHEYELWVQFGSDESSHAGANPKLACLIRSGREYPRLCADLYGYFQHS